MKNKRTKEGRVYKMKEKEIKKLNSRNYFNCTSNYNNCFTYSCRRINCNANRREWNTYTSTKC